MDYRPDPDALLKSIQSEDHTSKEGKFRIFFGMAAGVGKTYAMLNAAHQKLKEGKKVVIGTIDTHGRKETEKMLEGIPIIPKQKINHRGVMMEEMDIDAILQMRPDIVLVDELAHTNVPGARHPKRWQDVLDILSKGINVYSTINIQHVESRKDDVEGITGVVIRETVPDSVIERANQIEVIDIPPGDLLVRLKEGKVYLEEKAREAVENFFKEDKLTALREILLRMSADKVDRELEGLIVRSQKDNIWKTKEKILVVVGHGPDSERRIRSAKQLATKLRAPWVALYVDTGYTLTEDEKRVLVKNLDLARELSAKVLTTSETDSTVAIDRVCRQLQVSQVVIGQPKRRWIQDFFRGGNIIDRLNKLDEGISFHVVRNQRLLVKGPLQMLQEYWPKRPRASQFAAASAWVLGITFINYMIHHQWNLVLYRTVGIIFLMGVNLAGIFFSLGPTIWASFLTVLIWNFFFIPPIFQVHFNSPDDFILCISFFLVATITGALASAIKRNQDLLRKQEERTGTLYQLSLNIVESQNKEECLDKVTKSISTFFKGHASITLKGGNGVLEFFKKGQDWVFNHPKEWSVAQWSFENSRPAGIWTDTLPKAKCMYIPLMARGENVGILGFRPETEDQTLSIADREVLFTICSQLGLYLQRELYHESALESERLKKAEKLHQTLLNSVSHEIKTPLTAITGIVEVLEKQDQEQRRLSALGVGPGGGPGAGGLSLKDLETRNQLQQSLVESTQRLKHVVDNILDMSRLDSGILALKLEWFDFADLVESVCERLNVELQDYKVTKEIPADFPLVLIDGRLMEQVLTNLLLNSARYCTKKTEILIKLWSAPTQWNLEVSDQGPGVPLEFRKLVFEKFYRLPNSKTGGTGLGLSIVKSIVELHKGNILILDGEQVGMKGARFLLSFPNDARPVLPPGN